MNSQRILYTTFFLSILLLSCNNNEKLYEEAKAFEKQGNYKKSIELLDVVIKVDPENVYALFDRAVDKSMINDFTGAISDYDLVIELYPDNPIAFLNRGKNKSRLGKYKEAIEDYNSAIDLKGSETFYLNKTENSIFENGYEFDATMEEIRFERGFSRYKIDSLIKSFEDLSFCIDKSYELGFCYLWRAHIYNAFEQNRECCLDLEFSEKFGNKEASDWIEKLCNKINKNVAQ
ncbi:tetratricopeptide repeat protein [uncultured Cyclobacterium sp.]|uniref:tetratricopeptide repeat protein n=1 Tax=uncultured Cyclobacterium sp. TaxID=453820 RepID=UPI0030EB71F0|tara:strand:- start:21 stop:719 length:699 start_codon:yes stop_codon:yes gene_type:complete